MLDAFTSKGAFDWMLIAFKLDFMLDLFISNGEVDHILEANYIFVQLVNQQKSYLFLKWTISFLLDLMSLLPE